MRKIMYKTSCTLLCIQILPHKIERFSTRNCYQYHNRIKAVKNRYNTYIKNLSSISLRCLFKTTLLTLLLVFESNCVPK